MIGKLLKGRYELAQELGEGPVFLAYVAHDMTREKNVVVRTVKQPFSREPEFIAKLRSVVGKIKSVTHPCLSAALEFDEHEGDWFLVHKYQPGQPLAQRLKKVDGLGISTSVAVMIKMLEGLDVLHRAGLVHGDLRAENVIISTEGEPTLLMAGVWEAYSSSDTAGAAMVPRIAPYLAPEISAGAMPSKQSDVYAMGVLLYEMLTGGKPFKETGVSDLAAAHAGAACPSLKQRLSAAPEALEKIIEKALDKAPSNRYQSAATMRTDLEILLDALKFGRPMTWPLVKIETRLSPRVGPKLNTVHAEERDKKMSERMLKDDSDGAPKWLVLSSTALLLGAVFVVGWWMLFRLNAPQTITVPDVVGMSFSEASGLLNKIHLKLRQTKQVSSEQYPEGIVLAIRPAASREIKEHSFVDATVSTGGKTVEVPNLAGMTFEEAKRLLAKMGLILSDKVQHVYSEETASGLIVSQKPAKHMQIAKKSIVEVEVSKGEAVIVPDEPPPAEPYLYHLSWNLPDGTASIKVRVEMRDATGQKTIYEAVHEPGDKVEIDIEGMGEKATFTIYYDDLVIKTLTQEAGAPPPPVLEEIPPKEIDPL